MSNNKKVKIGILIGGFIVIFSISFLISDSTQKENFKLLSPVKTEEKIVQTSSIENTVKATLEIEGKKYSGEIENGESVYKFMLGLKEDGKINFKDKTYTGMGKFIEEIDGIKGNGDKYWIYYVNDKKAKIGVSNYKINPGDVVSWKYEKDY